MPIERGGPRILPFGCDHLVVAEDPSLPEKPGILICQAKCPNL